MKQRCFVNNVNCSLSCYLVILMYKKKKMFSVEAEVNSLFVHTQLQLSLVVRKQVLGVPTRSDTNRAVQLQKIARGLKFPI